MVMSCAVLIEENILFGNNEIPFTSGVRIVKIESCQLG